MADERYIYLFCNWELEEILGKKASNQPEYLLSGKTVTRQLSQELEDEILHYKFIIFNMLVQSTLTYMYDVYVLYLCMRKLGSRKSSQYNIVVDGKYFKIASSTSALSKKDPKVTVTTDKCICCICKTTLHVVRRSTVYC